MQVKNQSQAIIGGDVFFMLCHHLEMEATILDPCPSFNAGLTDFAS